MISKLTSYNNKYAYHYMYIYIYIYIYTFLYVDWDLILSSLLTLLITRSLNSS